MLDQQGSRPIKHVNQETECKTRYDLIKDHNRHDDIMQK